MRLSLALSLFALSTVALAETNKQAEALLAKMRNAYKTTKTAQFTTKATGVGGVANQKLTVDITYASPIKVHALVKGLDSMSGRPLTVVSDGSNIKTLGLEEMSFKMPYSPDALSALLLGNLEMLSFWDYERQLSTKGNMKGSGLTVKPGQKWNGKTWTVLEEAAKGMNRRISYYVDPKTYLIWRTEVRELNGKKLIANYEILSMKTGITPKPGLFKMT